MKETYRRRALFHGFAEQATSTAGKRAFDEQSFAHPAQWLAFQEMLNAVQAAVGGNRRCVSDKRNCPIEPLDTIRCRAGWGRAHGHWTVRPLVLVARSIQTQAPNQASAT
jgi:hypothetical protein